MVEFQLTPPRGGDARLPTRPVPSSSFQLTPPRGGDDGTGWDTSSGGEFQLTPPRGGDNLSFPTIPNRMRFNSRPREGATTKRVFRKVGVDVSTHAPARGRRSLSSLRVTSSGFQLTPPRGGDKATAPFAVLRSRFNSRPREGATQRIIAPDGAVDLFQLTPPRGGDLKGSGSGSWKSWFQLTPPRGGDPAEP